MVMATITDSFCDENSRAPGNFQVCDELDGGAATIAKRRDEINLLAGTNSVTGCMKTLKCPLCSTNCRVFFCRNCVRNGIIVHSDSKWLHEESLTEKQKKYMGIQASLKVVSNRFERLIKEQKAYENMKYGIKEKKEQLNMLKKLIAQKTIKNRGLKEERGKLHKANAENRKKLPNYPIKVEELGNYVLDRREKINLLRINQYELQEMVQQKRCRDIQQLIEYIFPISEVVLKEEKKPLPKTEDSETIAALAEAKNTSYIRGKWVFHGSGISEMQFRIVAPSLPANGDYAAYIDWLSENKDDVPKSASNDIAPSRVHAFRIVGALTYTTQLMQLMSYYLNVRLPYKLAYGDFCKRLNEKQFHRKVSRLNTNVLYLAYTQQVCLNTLNEKHTLENILAILDLEQSDLGCHGNHEVNNAPPLNDSVDSILMEIETESESEDWESLPDISRQQEIMPMTPVVQHSTISEGLITSAANRITSLFRWPK